MSALASLLAAYDDPPVPEAGVVGYVGADVPRELIAAAGLHPLPLRGSAPITERADAILGPGVPAPVRSVLAGVLEGSPRLDFLLVSHDSEGAVRLFTALRVLAGPLPELWFLDLLHLPTETTARYNRDRIRDLIRVLERWSGREVTEDGLRAAAAEAEETRRLLLGVSSLRRAGGIPGSTALAVAGAAASLPTGEANRLLGELLAEPFEAAAPGRRVFVTGSEAGPGLYRALEAHGLHVAAESFERHAGPSHVAREARAAGADVVLAWIRSGDDALAWRVPALRDQLEIPLVVLDRREDETIADDELVLLG